VDVAAFAADHNLMRSMEEVLDVIGEYDGLARRGRSSTQFVDHVLRCALLWHYRLLGVCSRLAVRRDTRFDAEVESAQRYIQMIVHKGEFQLDDREMASLLLRDGPLDDWKLLESDQLDC
jgi:hypothetical protein